MQELRGKGNPAWLRVQNLLLDKMISILPTFLQQPLNQDVEYKKYSL